MVDVAIGGAVAPELRVIAEVRPHVLVDGQLEVDADRPQRTHDDIGAHASIARDIATGKGNLPVRGVVMERDADLSCRCPGDSCARRVGTGLSTTEGRDQGGDQGRDDADRRDRNGRARRIVPMSDKLPCLDLLEATPEILRGIMAEVSDEDARWKPAPDRFSIAEVLAHLSHSEGHCYRARVERFLSEDLPLFEPDDAQMYLDLYRDADPEEQFGDFEDQRESNLELLRGLAPGSGARRARHRAAGEITLSQMLHEWALHDLGHVRQVAELVRARRYLAGAGPLGDEYRLKP
jgi:hypothetical protein